MATLEDLNYDSITEMSNDEAIEMLRQIRLSRRTPNAKPKSVERKATMKKQTTSVDAETAAKLLKILGGL